MELLQRSYPLILKYILGHLGTEALINCRLVNSYWNYEACRCDSLRRRKPISFSSGNDLRRYCDTFDNSDPSISLSVQGIELECRLFTDAMRNRANGDLDKLQEGLQRLMEVSGKNVLELAVTIQPIFTFQGDLQTHLHSTFMLEQLSKLVHEGFPNLRHLHLTLLIGRAQLPENFDVNTVLTSFPNKELPNLKKVTLKLHDLVPGPNERVISGFLQKLFSSAVSLRFLSSWSRWDNRDGYLLLKDTILDTISFVSSNLRSLTIMETLSDSDLKALILRGFPNLETVEISIDGYDVNEDTLKLFLLQNQNSLRSLRLSFVTRNWKPVEFCPQFPPPAVIMNQLETLQLKFYRGGAVAFRNMPKLQRLSLYRCSNLSQIICSQQQQSTPPPQLKTIDVTGWSISEKFPHKVPFWFSILTSLSISDAELPQLSQIFKKATRLRSLSIKFCSGVDDAMICGIDTKSLESVSHCPIRNLAKDASAEEVVNLIMKANKEALYRKLPYIGDLKELRFLTLKGDLSDASVLYGIANCRKLKRLHLTSFTHNFSWRTRLLIKHGLEDLVKLSLLEEDEAVVGIP